ncbi:unnamed protein product [Pylaiella littoralis]
MAIKPRSTFLWLGTSSGARAYSCRQGQNMGLCFETLHQDKMAAEANRQAWKVLLEQRERRRESPGGGARATTKTKGNNGGKPETASDDDNEIGMILLQAKRELTSCSSRGAYSSGGWSRGSTPQQLKQQHQREGGKPGPAGPGTRYVFLRMARMASCPKRGGGAEAGLTRKEAAAEEARVQALGFELWCKKPYTWFRLGKVVLEAGCYSLALAFLVKAVALLPAGLQQQEKGRVSDACTAAEQARDLDPFGKEVRLLCPRFMALHSEDAGSQYTRQSLSAARVQRAWRGHRVVRVLGDSVSKQIAALRIQRFMREWKSYNNGLALRLVAASAIELNQLSASYSSGLGLATKSAASERLQALVISAVAVQRAGRALIARLRVIRRRQAVAAVQAFWRGCRARWALSIALEETLRLGLTSRDRDLRQQRDGGGCGGGGDDIDEGKGARPTTLLSPPQGNGPALQIGSLLSRVATTLQVGTVTRRNIPMDAGFPEGFGPPDLGAFLWEKQEEAYGSGSGFGTEKEPPLLAPHSNVEGRDRCLRAEINSRSEDDYGDGAVFEVSATAVLLSVSHHNKRENWPPSLHETIDTPSRQQPLLARWVPAAVAPEETLERALECSTLIINSPSFGSACARRLFSRIGRTLPRPVPQPPPPPRGHPTDTDRFRAALSEEVGGGGAVSLRNAHAEDAGQHLSSQQRLHRDVLRHVMVLGESPIGDGGLAELSSAVRCGWLPRLTTLVIGGPGCRVGPRGVMTLAMALSSPGCSRLRNLSLSNCCSLAWRRPNREQHRLRPAAAAAVPSKLKTAMHSSWDCFFRHLQRLPSLSTLSLQRCGLEDCNIRSLSIALQILPVGRLRCLRLDDNYVGRSGLKMLLMALTSRRMRLPALWLRNQRPALVESESKRVVEAAFQDGLFAEVEFEGSYKVLGGRSQLVLMERTTESEDLGNRVKKHPTCHIYV